MFTYPYFKVFLLWYRSDFRPSVTFIKNSFISRHVVLFIIMNLYLWPNPTLSVQIFDKNQLIVVKAT